MFSIYNEYSIYRYNENICPLTIVHKCRPVHCVLLQISHICEQFQRTF